MANIFPLIDVPDPEELQIEFVYNFFVPDERFNDTGSGFIDGDYSSGNSIEDFLAKQITQSKKTARFIKLKWPMVGSVGTYYNAYKSPDYALEGLYESNGFDVTSTIYEEEDFVGENAYWVWELNDPNGKFRLKGKLEELSTELNLLFEETAQSKKLADKLGLEKGKYVSPLIKPSPQDLIVNFIPGKSALENLYERSSNFRVNALINTGYNAMLFHRYSDSSPTSVWQLFQSMKEASRKLETNVKIPNAKLEGDILEIEYTGSDQNEGIISIEPVGYLIEKREIIQTSTGIQRILTKIPISNHNITEYRDDKIKYGATYSYAVKNIFRMEANISRKVEGQKNPEKIKLITNIASKSSPTKKIRAEESIAPQPPDGVFYRFNYNEGRGLIITWQFPPGKSRDVKYFQVFRRSAKIGPNGELIKAIDQPFECIAEIDFNDTDTSQFPPPPKPEQVRRDRVIKENYARLFYEDLEFGREDTGIFGSFIYAVCAVDAHGLSSGYSAQSQVTFNRIKNRIEIKNISKPGAPKQYPNFFIDPRMDDNITVDSFSQDVILDSGCTAIDVIFAPDARTVFSGDKSINVFSTQQSEGNTQNRYKIHAINLDLQKSDIKEIVIKDST